MPLRDFLEVRNNDNQRTRTTCGQRADKERVLLSLRLSVDVSLLRDYQPARFRRVDEAPEQGRSGACDEAVRLPDPQGRARNPAAYRPAARRFRLAPGRCPANA